MCGIFGVVFGKDASISADFVGEVMRKLYVCSQTRGSEAAGLTVVNGESIDVLKQAGSVERFLAAEPFHKLMDRAQAMYAKNRAGASPIALAMTGHTRLVTNGFQSNEDNNQPVIANGTVGIHNGIIVNDGELWSRFPSLHKKSDVDTEVLVNILRKHFDDKGDIAWATQQAYREICFRPTPGRCTTSSASATRSSRSPPSGSSSRVWSTSSTSNASWDRSRSNNCLHSARCSYPCAICRARSSPASRRDPRRTSAWSSTSARPQPPSCCIRSRRVT
jgi:hypothetical protein